MTDRDTPTTLRAIATMMRMEGYRPDAAGVKAFILDNAANEIERLRKAMQDAITEANQPSYGDPFAAFDYYYDAISILKNALEGK